MKPTTKKFLSCILAWQTIFTMVLPARALEYSQPPNLAPMRAGIVDSRTYNDFFEKNKRYNELLTVLLTELAAIEILTASVEDDQDLLHPFEKDSAQKLTQQENPSEYFHKLLKNHQVNKKTGIFDLEGKLYLSDAIAELYTFGLVNFKQAQIYNNQAKIYYNQIQMLGLSNVPISNYFNSQRDFFYTFFEVPKENKDNPSGEYHNVPGREDLLTPFDQNFLDTVRKNDFKKVGGRIEKREKFLKENLSGYKYSDKLLPPNTHESFPLELYNQWEKFITESSSYSQFEISFNAAAQAVSAYRSDRKQIHLDKIIKHGEQALRNINKINPQKINEPTNFLHYWLAMAYLQIGNYDSALQQHQYLLAGIEANEKINLQKFKDQQRVVKQVNEELTDSAYKKQIFLGVALAVALAAAGAYSYNSAPNYSSVQDLVKAFTASEEVARFSVINQFSFANVEASTRSELSKIISPYTLKLLRYMNKFELVEYLLALGKGYERSGQLNDAATQYEEAIKIIETQRATILTESERIAFFAAKQELYDLIIPLFIKMEKVEQSLEYIERAKSRAFLDILGDTRLTLKTNAQTTAYESSKNYQNELATIVSSNEVSVEQLSQFVERWRRAIPHKNNTLDPQKIDADKQQFDIEFASLTSAETLSSKSIIDLAGRETDLLEYYLTDNHLIIIHISNGIVTPLIRPLNKNDIIQKTNEWLTALKQKNNSLPLSAYFYNEFIKPIEDNFTSQQLIILPHNFLHYLPFQAFHDGSQYLIERYAVSYAPSATVLEITGNKKSASIEKSLIIGNPTGDLLFAEKEARTIAGFFQDSIMLTKDDATETKLKNNSDEYGIIHFATHGQFDSVHPMQSGLLLSSDATNDGNLTTNELFGMTWNASLVTLSACETGLSKTMKGDELIGLQRGIFFAGAKSLVSSQWKVNDRATYFLMEEFYKSLKEGMPKNIALQKAQVNALKHNPVPYYWAAFNLSGAVN